jgi:hypothetical protein
MSAFDAVDVSSTGIAMCHIAVSFDRIANVRCCHKTDVLTYVDLCPQLGVKQTETGHRVFGCL